MPTGTNVWLFTGCVMDAWQRDVHRAAITVLTATGAGVALAGRGGDCCGALHVHAGLLPAARGLADRVMTSMPGEAPILVDSAGCGAQLKDYGHLLGTDAAGAFSARVRDIHEWLAEHADRLPPARHPLEPVIVQDPCHLRHVSGRTWRCAPCSAATPLIELDDEGLCCGAGGLLGPHPDLAGQMRERKLGAIARAGGGVVASANPVRPPPGRRRGHRPPPDGARWPKESGDGRRVRRHPGPAGGHRRGAG